jgi:hypothetical protein
VTLEESPGKRASETLGVRVVTGSNPVAPTIPFFNLTNNLIQVNCISPISPDRHVRVIDDAFSTKSADLPSFSVVSLPVLAGILFLYIVTAEVAKKIFYQRVRF